MKKHYQYPFLEVQDINVEDLLLTSTPLYEEDPNEEIIDWPW